MSQNAPEIAAPGIPRHVPNELVYDFDYFAAPQGLECPHAEVARRLHADAPAIFYTPRNGGHWVVTRYEEGLEISRHCEMFSNDPQFNSDRRVYPRWAPIEYDPPEHTALRQLISPSFTPAAVEKMANSIRELACELIDEVRPEGRCEFVADIAKRYPITIFLRLANAPAGDRDGLLALAHDFLRSPDQASRAKARSEMGRYLTELLAERARRPGEDLLSVIATSRLPDRPLTDEERLGFASLAFFAGLDTVTATLSFIIYFLAKNPAHYQRLVTDRASIEYGLEELIRVHGTNCTPRGISHDFEFRGIQFRTGDRLIVLRPVIGFDDRHTKAAQTVDFDRDVSTHLAFGAGPHRCVGSHLARLELRTFLEEWTKRVPRFAVGQAEISGGIVWAPTRLPLTWDVGTPASI